MPLSKAASHNAMGTSPRVHSNIIRTGVPVDVQALQGLCAHRSQEAPERAYLAAALQRQGDRAMKLFQGLREVEQRLAELPAEGAGKDAAANRGSNSSSSTKSGGEGRGTSVRKLRKQAALLRRRLSEAEQQGRLILQRLSEIHGEPQRQAMGRMQGQQQAAASGRHRPVVAPVLPLVYSEPFWAIGTDDYNTKPDALLWGGNWGTGLPVISKYKAGAEELARSGASCPGPNDPFRTFAPKSSVAIV